MAKLVPTSTFDYGAKFPSISKQSKGKLQYLEKQLFIHGFAAAKAALRIGEEAVAARKILVEQEGLTAKEHIAWCSASSRVHESYIYKCMRMYESFGDVPNIGLGPRGMMMLIENGDKDAIDKAKKKANGVSMSIPQVEKLIHDVDKAKVKSGKKLEAPTKKKTAKKKTPPAQKPKDRMTDKACAKCGANVYEENKQFGWVCVNCDTPHGFTKKDLQAPEEEKPTDDYGTQMPAAIARIFADPSPASQLQLLRKTLACANR